MDFGHSPAQARLRAEARAWLVAEVPPWRAAHGGDPWWSVAIRLLLEYGNLHLKTSAHAPKYLPTERLHFMNTRGQDEVIFASDPPTLPMERAVKEARALELRPGVLEKYLRANAERVFFGGAA